MRSAFSSTAALSLLVLARSTLAASGVVTDATLAANQTFDYIVVGAGPGGGTVATRLSEDPHIEVLLIEAGPE